MLFSVTRSLLNVRLAVTVGGICGKLCSSTIDHILLSHPVFDFFHC